MKNLREIFGDNIFLATSQWGKYQQKYLNNSFGSVKSTFLKIGGGG